MSNPRRPSQPSAYNLETPDPLPLPAAMPEWRVSKPAQRQYRSRKKPWVIVGIVCGVVLLVSAVVGIATIISAVGNRVRERAKQDQTLADLQGKMESLSRQALNSDDPNAASDAITQWSAELDKTASTMSGVEAVILRAGVKINRLLQDSVLKYEAAFEAFENAGGLDPATLKSRLVIEQRLVLVKAASQANQSLIEALRKSPQDLRDELQRSNLRQSITDAALRGFEKSSQLDLVLQIRDTDHRLCQSMNGILGVLQEQWGHWKCPPNDDGVEFESDSALQTYNRHMEQLMNVAQEQDRLQQQLLRKPTSS